MKIAIIGIGEVGYTYTLALLNAKYFLDIYTPRPTEKVENLASDKENVTLHKSMGPWLNNIDLIISCVPGHISLDVFKDAIPFMKKGSTYADFSSASAMHKRLASELSEQSQISYIDVVIMGSIALHGIHTQLVCAGNNTNTIKDLMESLGAPIRVLPNAKAGDAASLKLLRSAFIKGLSALAVECVIAAESQGIKSLFYEALSDMDKTSISQFLDMLICNQVEHACRQIPEVVNAKEQIKNLNLPVNMITAAEKVFTITCEFRKIDPIKESLSIQEALDWLINKTNIV